METKLRQAGLDDVAAITELFTSTIRAVNSKDYTPHEIEAWSAVPNFSGWNERITEQYFLLAEKDSVLLGFASLAKNGLVDLFYVSKDHQREGVGTLLMNAIEKNATSQNIKRLYAEVSITARPFFEAKGFKLVKIFTKMHKGIGFTDNLMEKYF